MEQLAPHFRVVAPCLRGHGFSTLNNRVKYFFEFIKDIKQLMCKVLKLKNFYVCGHSMGAGVAMVSGFSLVHQVTGLFLISTMSPEGIAFTGINADIEGPEEFKVKANADNFQVVIRNQQFDLYLEKFIKPMGVLPEPLTKHDYYKKWMYSVGMFRNPYDLMWAISEHNFNISKQLKNIMCPVSLIFGGQD